MSRSILGLIPARGGSKGLPGKNLALMNGKPLLAWTVEAALDSGVLDAVVVTTDDAAIAEAAHAAGAEVVERPGALATDTSSVADAVVHALDVLAGAGRAFTHVMLLQPTSPLRSAADIRDAVDRLEATGGTAVVSVARDEHSPLLSNTLPEDGSMAAFLKPEVATANRQALPDHYRLNGAIYLVDAEQYRRTRTFIGEGTYALVMPAERSVDVDSATDLALAELLSRRARPDGA